MRRAVLGVASLALAVAPAAAAPDRSRVEFRFADPAIVESSGLVARGGLFVTTNDSGDDGRLYAVDPATGATVGVTDWSDDATDVEALAPAGRRAVWVGDIGDNQAERDAVTVARVPVGRGDRTVSPPTYELVYPDGPRDAETLLAEPGSGRLVVVTKGVFGGEVLRAPARLDPDRPNRLRRVGSALGIATDGSFFPDGRHLVVRSYTSAVVYTWPGLDAVARLDLPPQEQGEGLAVDEDGAVFLSSEGAGTAVLRLRLPRALARTVVPPPPPEPTPAPSTAPTSAPSNPPTGSAPSPKDERAADPERSAWPWLLGGVAGLVVLVVLARSLRPRG